VTYGPRCVAGVLRSSSARLRSIKGTERCERRRAAIRALQQAVERFADATAFIPSASAAQFSNPQQYEGQTVSVPGKITLYHGKPEIIVTSPCTDQRTVIAIKTGVYHDCKDE
jgi:hypothetical protein